MALWVVLVFVSAGRVNWLRGWVCSAIYLVTMGMVGVIVSRGNPGLLAARAKWRHRDSPLFDRVFLATYTPLTLAQIVVSGLDAGRFHWLPLARWTFSLGLGLYLVAMGLVLWALLVNPFAETVVRIQSERGHRVIAAGPYRAVRHPMYAGLLLLYPATAWMFGSGWALVLSALIAGLTVWRTAKEDDYLRARLQGYAAYAAGTRYRLVPGLW